jgi:RimJ/RimL family protein N-acetyltransferase
MVNNFDEIFKSAFAHPVLTARMEIRPATQGDADTLAAFFMADGMAFVRELEWPEGDYDPGYIREEVLPHWQALDPGNTLRLFMFERESGTAIGELSFWKDGQNRTMLYYFVLPSRRKQGYAMEAAAACLDRAQEAGIRDTFRAEALPENEASLRLLRRLGFIETRPVVSQIARYRGQTLAAFEMDMAPLAPELRFPPPL